MKMLILSALFCAMMALTTADGKDPVKPAVLHCDDTLWELHNGHCFRYVSNHMTWATAQKNCLRHHAQLASVHSSDEYHAIQELIKSRTGKFRKTWIGGSNSNKDGVWLWTDGTPMKYTNWCPKQPNNSFGNQHCLQMNYGANKCWDDEFCYNLHPSVCAKKANVKA